MGSTWRQAYPVASPVNCCAASGNSASPCTFNPTLVSVPVTGQDCNENDVDDAIEIALETSRDDNENGIPDDCENTVPAAATWSFSVAALLLLTIATLALRGRRLSTA